MIDRFNSSQIRKYATREMMANKTCEHAVYGICFQTLDGNILHKFARTPDEIKYFFSNESFNRYVRNLEDEFSDDELLTVYAVHRDMVKSKLPQIYEPQV